MTHRIFTSGLTLPTKIVAAIPAEGKESERVVWRTDLRATRRHWRGWFEGMSKAFLDLSIPKVHILVLGRRMRP